MNLIMAVVLLCATTEGLEEPRLVYPRLVEGRSSDGKLVLHINEDLTLNLEQATVAAPLLRLFKEEDGASVTEMYDGHEINSNLYQDRDQLATVEVKLKIGNAEITGIVGPNHRIEPVPTMERSESGLIPHMVYEIQHTKVHDKAVSLLEKAEGPRFIARQNRATDNVPEEIIVEVFFVADRMHHSIFKGEREALVYFCILLNSVNLRMSDMQNPRVRLGLTGLDRSWSDDFVDGNAKVLHDSRTLEKFLQHGQRKKSQYGDPDVLFLVTGRDVATGANWDKSATGIAYVGGACATFFVGLGEDAPGLFTGMHTVTHELGHLLGCVHDGNGPDPNIIGHPGAANCPWANGYIMSYVNKGPNHHKFSSCCLQQMRFILTMRGEDCWKVVSTTRNESSKYPGYRNITLKICKKVYPNKANVIAEVIKENGNECKLKCQYSVKMGRITRHVFTHRDVPDFTPCGEEMACVRGLCIRATIRRKNAREGRHRRRHEGGHISYRE